MSHQNPSPKLVHIVTTPITAWSFLRGQLRFMREQGFDVTLISAPGSELDQIRNSEGVKTISVPMRREPSPFADSVSLVRLIQVLKSLQPNIVHCGTPKASFLGGMAAWLARVPVRLMTLHGLRADGLRQPTRGIVLGMERMSCRAAHRIYCVGESLRQRALEQKLAPSKKLKILENGTANGIDSRYFSKSPAILERSETLLKERALTFDGPVIGFVGRLVRDKGISELIAAFQLLKKDFPNVKLLVVGDFEEYDRLANPLKNLIARDSQIIHLGFLKDPRPAYQLMTVLALPSYREGFPYVPMEAAAMGLPVVTTMVTGCRDAVQDQVTGTIIPPRDATALANAIRRYFIHAELAKSHGLAGRERVVRDFKPEPIWISLAREYRELLAVAKSSAFVPAAQDRPHIAENQTLKESNLL